MEDGLYVVQVTEDQEQYEYEYGNLKHAREHFEKEQEAIILEYKDGEYYFVQGK